MPTDLQRDRSQQLRLLPALDVSPAHLRRDDCGWWIIAGRHGAIHTWGDDQTWVAYIRSRSARHWTAVKRRLNFMKVTQDGTDEGCLRLFALPTPKQAALIREALGLRKRRVMTKGALEKLDEARANSPVGGRLAASPALPGALLPLDAHGAEAASKGSISTMAVKEAVR